MTGVVAVSTVVGMLNLIAGVLLGWYLRRPTDACPTCGEKSGCDNCELHAILTEQRRVSPGFAPAEGV